MSYSRSGHIPTGIRCSQPIVGRTRFFESTFLETIFCAVTAMRSPLARRIQESNFSNCFKLVEQAKSSAIKEIHMSEDELMSFIDIAKAANIPLSTVYYLHRKGEGPVVNQIGRHLRVTRKAYETWIQQNKK